MKYALIDNITSEVLRVEDHTEKPEDPVGKGWIWLPYEEKRPTYDPATQRLGTEVVSHDGVTCTKTWQVDNLPEKTSFDLWNEAREFRKSKYPALGDQLDALWKFLQDKRDKGEVLDAETAAMLDIVLTVKLENPVPPKPDIVDIG